ncbi:MAG: GntR family transcriptional regulator [Thermoguttaceae bacterium]
MFFNIDFSNELAIYDQIIRQVKFAVAGGLLKPGEMVPSVRDLARELTLNPNTVARAYRQLQSDGILTSLRGMGLVVAEGTIERCRQERVELIRARLEQVLAEAKHAGLSAEKIFALVRDEWKALGKKLE